MLLLHWPFSKRLPWKHHLCVKCWSVTQDQAPATPNPQTWQPLRLLWTFPSQNPWAPEPQKPQPCRSWDTFNGSHMDVISEASGMYWRVCGTLGIQFPKPVQHFLQIPRAGQRPVNKTSLSWKHLQRTSGVAGAAGLQQACRHCPMVSF